jgi:hypothetical protein
LYSELKEPEIQELVKHREEECKVSKNDADIAELSYE